MPMERFSECFSALPDPRANNAVHDLTEILFIALLATLCGAQTCCDIALFAKTKEALLRTVLVLAHGVPSHDTFSRVFRMLDPKAFEKAFRRFMRAFAETTEGVVAIDGKALRRAYDSGKSHMPPIMVTAWSAQTRMALANAIAVGSNEAAAALQLIDLLTLKGCVVTADALHCHRAMAQAIIERKGDYALAVKGNQSVLLRDAQAAIAVATRQGAGATVTVDDRHGRHETRVAVVAPAGDMAERHDFPGLKAVAQIQSKRGQDTIVERYFLLSRHYRPQEAIRIIRQHWTIENELHWPLDVLLDEDLARSRKDNAPVNLAVLRRLALNIARSHPDTKISLRAKFKRAGWDEAFLFDMLRHMR
jgi:predicted transposase YbfD/YdcC